MCEVCGVCVVQGVESHTDGGGGGGEQRIARQISTLTLE